MNLQYRSSGQTFSALCTKIHTNSPVTCPSWELYSFFIVIQTLRSATFSFSKLDENFPFLNPLTFLEVSIMAHGSAVLRISFLGLFLAILSFLSFCSAADRIRQGQLIKDGENITSDGKKFVLGFFSPDGTNRYVGIWYNQISELSVVWVANREKPILDRNGAFGITGNGNFVVLDGNNESVWSTNTSVTSSNAAMFLTDNGELIISKNGERSNNNNIWSSFLHPTDTFLPEMETDASPSVGERKLLTSWTSSSNPSPGRFSMGIDTRASPQIVVWDGDKRHWRSGHWDGRVFLGVPIRTDFVYGFTLNPDNRDSRLYLEYTSGPSELIMFKIDWNGTELQQRWNNSTKQWDRIQAQPADVCGIYNHCGQFARCDFSDSNVCSCLDGFEPSDWNQWNAGNRSGGCVRRTPLQCQKNNTDDGFLEVKNIKLPDFADNANDTETPEECKRKCEEDCTCTAYASPVAAGIPCLIWRNELVDIMQLDQGSGSTLFIRLAASELGNTKL